MIQSENGATPPFPCTHYAIPSVPLKLEW